MRRGICLGLKRQTRGRVLWLEPIRILSTWKASPQPPNHPTLPQTGLVLAPKGGYIISSSTGVGRRRLCNRWKSTPVCDLPACRRHSQPHYTSGRARLKPLTRHGRHECVQTYGPPLRDIRLHFPCRKQSEKPPMQTLRDQAAYVTGILAAGIPEVYTPELRPPFARLSYNVSSQPEGKLVEPPIEKPPS